MANHLSMAKANGILELHQAGWSQRRIASALNIDRKTVAAYLEEDAAKRAKAPTGFAVSTANSADDENVADGEQQGKRSI